MREEWSEGVRSCLGRRKGPCASGRHVALDGSKVDGREAWQPCDGTFNTPCVLQIRKPLVQSWAISRQNKGPPLKARTATSWM